MSALIKLQILERLTTILQEIKQDGGFYTETKGVYRGRNRFGDESEIPLIALLEAPRADVALWATEDRTVSKDSWTILIQGFAPIDPKNPLDPAYRYLADVEKQLGKIAAQRSQGRSGGQYPEYYMLGNLISGIEVEQAVVRPPEEGVSSTAFFYQPVRFTLVRDLNCN